VKASIQKRKKERKRKKKERKKERKRNSEKIPVFLTSRNELCNNLIDFNTLENEKHCLDANQSVKVIPLRK
jgi:hypothetical protein